MKALIVYGTRGGSTKQIAGEIGKVFGEQGFVVTIRDAKDTRGVDVNAFDLVLVGSSVWATKWKRQATGFLKRNAKKLAGKKVALFSSGMAGDDPAKMDYANECIAKTAAKFPGIKPLALAYFGGCVNFDSPSFMARFMANMMKKNFEKQGIDTSKPVDHRDWEAIRKWAADVAAKAK
ncbi:MAG TPA: flavodoxin domain-containing protein [Methanocella sp.]|jgi:menaquinone-dependent protoporphyrinogen oxidase